MFQDWVHPVHVSWNFSVDTIFVTLSAAKTRNSPKNSFFASFKSWVLVFFINLRTKFGLNCEKIILLKLLISFSSQMGNYDLRNKKKIFLFWLHAVWSTGLSKQKKGFKNLYLKIILWSYFFTLNLIYFEESIIIE